MGKILLPAGAAPATPASGYTALAVDSNGDLTWEKDSGHTGKIVISADATLTLGASTWTPVLQFGGATTGITYSTQTGTYIRIGDLVFINGKIALTSKGSATGTATLAGLPVTCQQVCTSMSFRWFGMTSTLVVMGVISAVASASVTFLGATAATTGIGSLTDAAFANTSSVEFTMLYQAS